MDVGLPDLNGVEACKRVATEYPNVPVVLVTSRAEVQDRVTGLEAGARDYISKPFAPSELLARVKVILREAALRETAQQRVRALESLALIDPLTRISNRRQAKSSSSSCRKPGSTARSWRRIGSSDVWPTPRLDPKDCG